jgi:hypothetical protein
MAPGGPLFLLLALAHDPGFEIAEFLVGLGLVSVRRMARERGAKESAGAPGSRPRTSFMPISASSRSRPSRPSARTTEGSSSARPCGSGAAFDMSHNLHTATCVSSDLGQDFLA